MNKSKQGSAGLHAQHPTPQSSNAVVQPAPNQGPASATPASQMQPGASAKQDDKAQTKKQKGSNQSQLSQIARKSGGQKKGDQIQKPSAASSASQTFEPSKEETKMQQGPTQASGQAQTWKTGQQVPSQSTHNLKPLQESRVKFNGQFTTQKQQSHYLKTNQSSGSMAGGHDASTKEKNKSTKNQSQQDANSEAIKPQSARRGLDTKLFQQQTPHHLLSGQLKQMQIQAQKLEQKIQDNTKNQSQKMYSAQAQQKEKAQLEALNQKIADLKAQQSAKQSIENQANQPEESDWVRDMRIANPDPREVDVPEVDAVPADLPFENAEDLNFGVFTMFQAEAVGTNSKDLRQQCQDQLPITGQIGHLAGSTLGNAGPRAAKKKNRKISEDAQEFDDRLCNQVEILLNRNHNAYKSSEIARGEIVRATESTRDIREVVRLEDRLEDRVEDGNADAQDGPSRQPCDLTASNLAAFEQNYQLSLFKPDWTLGATGVSKHKKKKKRGIYKKMAPADVEAPSKVRSRTETPSKAENVGTSEINQGLEIVNNGAGDPIMALGPRSYRIRQGLVSSALNNIEAKRNATPAKILQKHLERQQRAEMLRAQIVQNRQKQLEKIKARQLDNKTRLDRMQEEKRTKLNDRIEHARENRNIELTNIKQRAQMDLQSVEDIKYIVRTMQNNLQLDINNKLNETEERRNQIHQELMKRVEDQKSKEQGAQKRRVALLNVKLEEIKKAEAKRQQAQQRKVQLIKQRQKVEVENEKRAQVLQRKMDLGEKINDMMSFVNDKDSIWDLIGNEESFKDGNSNQKDIFEIGLSKIDLLNLEKLQLRQDAEFLNKIISFNDEGKVQVKIEQGDYQQYLKMLRGNEFLENSSSDSSDLESADERTSNFSGRGIQYRFLKTNNRDNRGEDLNKSMSSYQRQHENSPSNQLLKKQYTNQSKEDFNQFEQNSDALASCGSVPEDQEDAPTNDDAFKQNFNDQLVQDGGFSTLETQQNQSLKQQTNSAVLGPTRSSNLDNSKNEKSNNQSARNEAVGANIDMTQSQYSNPYQMQGPQLQPYMTDEEEQFMLIESRIHWSIKRNILRDTMSEDLEWAQCIKNENEDFFDKLRQQNAYQGNLTETRSLESTPERKKPMGESIIPRERSCDDRIFGSASSRRRFKRSSRINSRKSSISSSMYQSLHKSKSKDMRVAGSLNGSSSILLESKQLQMLNKETQASNLSKNKRMNRENSRDSYDSHRIKGRSSIGTIQPRNLFQNTTSQINFGANAYMTEDTKDDTSLNMTSVSHATNFGSQMNQLITNMKPIIPFGNTKITPKLSSNAQKILFPIREQKILFKRPGIAAQFINVKVTLRLEDMQSMIANSSAMQSSQTLPQQQSAAGPTSRDSDTILARANQMENSVQIQENSIADKSNESTPKKPTKEARDSAKILSSGGAAWSLTTNGPSSQAQMPPAKTHQSQKEKKEASSANSKIEKTPTEKDKLTTKQPEAEDQPTGRALPKSDKDLVFKEYAIKYLLGGQYNDLIKNEDGQKSIELNDDDPQKIKEIEQFLDRLESRELHFRYCRLCECILQEEPTPNAQAGASLAGAIGGGCLASGFAAQEQEQADKVNCSDGIGLQTSTSPPQQADQMNQSISTQPQQAEIDQSSSQFGEGREMADRAAEAIGSSPSGVGAEYPAAWVARDATQSNGIDVNLMGAQYVSEQMVIAHVQNYRHHKKIREDLGIKDFEDQCFSILYFGSCPGDISKDLIREKEKALKRKVKRLKVQLQQMAVSHESAGCQQAWKDCASLNKKTLQIRCLDLEKQVNPVIRDYDALEQNLKEIAKLLQAKNQGDLMLFRKLKFIPTLVDICKRILICPRQEFKHLGKAIELSIRIIAIFCSLRENRNYMLQTNRIMPLVDLLNWCMNRPTQIFFGIGFLPQLFQIIALHIKHRTPYECIQCKEYLIEVLICSQLMHKIKSKFLIINYPMAMDTGQMMGQVPLFLLKSITFLEGLTSVISSDARYRPAYERNNKLGEHYLFVIENTEMFGIINMIATLLLTHSEQFKTSCNSAASEVNATKLMPQTFLSLSIVSIKVLNNIIRMDVKFVQQLLVNSEILVDHLFHLMNYLLVYTHENYDKSEDSKELLHETLLFIGYFCLMNEKTQQILQRGENTIMQKLCNLPFPYFSDKKLKEILFPTLIMASYRSERCVAIMDQEISFDPLIKFLQDNMKEELPRIMEEEFDYQSISSLGERGGAAAGRRGRSPSKSSTNSSGCSVQMESVGNGNCPYLPLFMRFPKSKWQDAIEFYQNSE